MVTSVSPLVKSHPNCSPAPIEADGCAIVRFFGQPVRTSANRTRNGRARRMMDFKKRTFTETNKG